VDDFRAEVIVFLVIVFVAIASSAIASPSDQSGAAPAWAEARTQKNPQKHLKVNETLFIRLLLLF